MSQLSEKSNFWCPVFEKLGMNFDKMMYVATSSWFVEAHAKVLFVRFVFLFGAHK